MSEEQNKSNQEQNQYQIFLKHEQQQQQEQQQEKNQRNQQEQKENRIRNRKQKLKQLLENLRNKKLTTIRQQKSSSSQQQSQSSSQQQKQEGKLLKLPLIKLQQHHPEYQQQKQQSQSLDIEKQLQRSSELSISSSGQSQNLPPKEKFYQNRKQIMKKIPQNQLLCIKDNAQEKIFKRKQKYKYLLAKVHQQQKKQKLLNKFISLLEIKIKKISRKRSTIEQESRVQFNLRKQRKLKDYLKQCHLRLERYLSKKESKIKSINYLAEIVRCAIVQCDRRAAENRTTL